MGVIASQNFNNLTGSTFTTDSLPDGSQLTNTASFNTDSDLGLTFATFWFDTRGVGSGPVTPTFDSSDFIGVNDFSGSNSPDVAPDGTPVSSSEKNFEFNDGDGRLDLVFAPVNLGGFTNRSLSFDYWINDTGFESDDTFSFSLSDGTNIETFLNFSETELESNASADDGSANWQSLNLDLESLFTNGFAEELTLTISADNNAATENIFVDNVSFNSEEDNGGVPLVINEVYASHTGADNTEFVELFGTPGASLAGLSLIAVEGNGSAVGSIDERIDFSADDVIGDNGFFLAGNGEGLFGNYGVLPNIDLDPNFENDSQTFALVETSSLSGGTVTGAEVVLDSVALVENDSDNTFFFDAPVVGPDGDFFPAGARRVEDGVDTDSPGDWVISDFFLGSANTPTPGTGGDGGGGGGADIGDFGDPATLISEVQGDGSATPLLGESVIIEGVVVGDFQSGLDGFFLQEEDKDADSNALTSEGVFVFAPDAEDVNVGDRVRLQGTADEFFDLTQINNVTGLLVDDSQDFSNLVTPVEVSLPVATEDFLERFEGALVNFKQELTVTETFNLGRFGEVSLSSGGRLFQGTNVAEPGAPANAVSAQNNLRRIILDDGQGGTNPNPIAYPEPELSADNSLRVGSTVNDLTGVLSFGFGSYRVQPTEPPNFVNSNPRTAAPDEVGGSLKVSAFNVLNFFNGDGMGSGFPTERGADTPSELVRQRDKLVSAITGIDADVLGLVELENDGYGPESAIQELVDALNAEAGAGTYDFIDPGLSELGAQPISVGFIYKPGAVTPVGDAAALTTGAFAFDDPRDIENNRNRVPLAQTFLENATGGTFTAAVNHFKSKGQSGLTDTSNPNFDQGDGQGFWNNVRTDAAQDLAEWLASDPTNSGDPDFLVLGDLNAYAMEDPVTALKNAGYTDLIDQFEDPADAYSFVFFGESGYLDHALSNESLTSQVTGLDTWHINADEPPILDYNEEGKSASQLDSLYNPDPYRSSDHDPLVLGLDLLQEVKGTSGDDNLVGTDTNEQLSSGDGDDTIAGGLGDDQIFGGDGDDVLRGDLNQRSPQVNVAGGDDIIFGGAGDDRIGGKAGNDQLFGDEGDDRLWGDAGDDILRGGLGDDELTGDDFSGGQGSDKFILALGEGTDTITDFEDGVDFIGLADGLTFGALSFTPQGKGEAPFASTLIQAGEETLAIVQGVAASSFSEADFVTIG